MPPAQRFSSSSLLSLALGLFLLLTGVQSAAELMTPAAKLGQSLGQFFGADQTSLVIGWVGAVFQIAAGVVLIAGPLGLVTGFAQALIFWIILGFWAALTVWGGYTGLVALQGRRLTFLVWLRDLSLNLAVLAALWQLKPASRK